MNSIQKPTADQRASRLVQAQADEDLIEQRVSGLTHPFFLRAGTSDLPTFAQVFTQREYDFGVEQEPEIIIDAGANIGLASIWFAHRFPRARIFSIEPEAANFRMMGLNLAPYPNVTLLHAALWSRNEPIQLVDPGLGRWGFQTRDGAHQTEEHESFCHSVPGFTVDRLMQDFGLPHIDILKIDIEGAEREVFQDSSAWLGRVRSLIIELHERLKPGCERSFFNGSNGFDREWRQGENIYLSRAGWLQPGESAWDHRNPPPV